MIRIALFRMLSILKARNSAMFCQTGTAYSKTGRTIVTNTLARETGRAPRLLEELWESKASCICLFNFIVYIQVISWFHCCGSCNFNCHWLIVAHLLYRKTSKRLRIYHAPCSISSYLVIQNTMKDAKNKSLWTKKILSQQGWQGDFCFQILNKNYQPL